MILLAWASAVLVSAKIEYAVMAPEMSWHRAAKACASNGWALAKVNGHNIRRVEQVLHQSGYSSGWVGSWDGRGQLSKNSAFLFRTGRRACCEVDTISIIPQCSLSRCIKTRVAICEIKCKTCPKKIVKKKPCNDETSASSSSSSSSSSSLRSSGGKKHHKRSYNSASVSMSESISVKRYKNRNEPVLVYSSIKPTHNILVNRSRKDFSLDNSVNFRRRRLVIIKVKCPECKQQQRLQKRGYSHKPSRRAVIKPQRSAAPQPQRYGKYWPLSGPFSSSSSSSSARKPARRHHRKRKARKAKTPSKSKKTAADGLEVSASVSASASVGASVSRSREKILVHYSESTVEEIEPAPHKCHHKPLVPRAIRHHRKFNKRQRSRRRSLSVSASVSASASVSTSL